MAQPTPSQQPTYSQKTRNELAQFNITNGLVYKNIHRDMYSEGEEFTLENFQNRVEKQRGAFPEPAFQYYNLAKDLAPIAATSLDDQIIVDLEEETKTNIERFATAKAEGPTQLENAKNVLNVQLGMGIQLKVIDTFEEEEIYNQSFFN